MESRFSGSLLGLAIGDALGYPAEFRSRAQIIAELGPGGIEDFVALKDPRFSRPVILGPDPPPGTYTDDTQMTLALADGLLDVTNAPDPDLDLDELMPAIGRRFVAWADSPQNDRAPGQTCLTGCANLRRGVPWREAGVLDSKGCGSAMRVAPIGLLYAHDLDRVATVARASSLLTHGHDAAVEGAAAAALMVALALQGMGPQPMYHELRRRCAGRSPDFDRCLERVPGLLGRPPAEALVSGGLGEGWVAEEAVASAIYCFWRHPDDYRAAVREGVNTDGDSDSIAAITGSVLGARLGQEGIPATWVERVENRALLEQTAARLYRARVALLAPVQKQSRGCFSGAAHHGAVSRASRSVR